MPADTNLTVNSLPVSQSQKLHEFIPITSHGEKTLERPSALHSEKIKRIGPEFGRLLERLNGIED
jgi:hypothetical protein